MPDNPNQSRDPVSGQYGSAIYPKDKVDIPTDDYSDRLRDGAIIRRGTYKRRVSDLARIGTNVYIDNSNIADSTIGDGAKIINSHVGNNTNVGANTFVHASNLAQYNEIGANSSIISSLLDYQQGHIGILDHVSIIASQIGQGTFVNSYTSIQVSIIGKTCSFARNSLVVNSRVGDNSVFGEKCEVQGADIAASVLLGRGVTIAGGCLVKSNTIIGDEVHIEAGVQLDHHVLTYNNVTIGAASNIGHDVVIEEGVVIGAGADIGDGAFLSKGCVIEDGARVRPGMRVKSGETFHNAYGNQSVNEET
jgi:UDP-3-O-[3-hydroxymyristoyl] glucosamine N-acyltransferase